MSDTRWLVLDAMGVIYRAGDDVAELLIPFVRARGCSLKEREIEDAYRLASLGRMSSQDFWSFCGISATDPEYIVGHRLTDGVLELVDAARRQGMQVACLSNDVREWAALQREYFGLHDLIDPWCVSGEIGVRKPDEKAYLTLLEMLNAASAKCLFVDDRPKNLAAARAVGMRAIHFDAALGGSLADLERHLT
jgi:HAD superfamily hydrolase (TIGR01509 family)